MKFLGINFVKHLTASNTKMNKIPFSECHAKEENKVLKVKDKFVNIKVREAFKCYLSESNIKKQVKVYVIVLPSSMQNNIVYSSCFEKTESEEYFFI